MAKSMRILTLIINLLKSETFHGQKPVVPSNLFKAYKPRNVTDSHV